MACCSFMFSICWTQQNKIDWNWHINVIFECVLCRGCILINTSFHWGCLNLCSGVCECVFIWLCTCVHVSMQQSLIVQMKPVVNWQITYCLSSLTEVSHCFLFHFSLFCDHSFTPPTPLPFLWNMKLRDAKVTSSLSCCCCTSELLQPPWWCRQFTALLFRHSDWKKKPWQYDVNGKKPVLKFLSRITYNNCNYFSKMVYFMELFDITPLTVAVLQRSGVREGVSVFSCSFYGEISLCD